MKLFATSTTVLCALLLTYGAAAQTDDDELKEAAVEALISAPPERALPLVQKVLAGEHSNSIKEKALFILSQIELAEAQTALLAYATDADGELQNEAIRMVGIGGNSDSLARLRSIYDSGSRDTREAVLEALMIAGDKATVFAIANDAEGDEFEDAVEMLGVMDASDELRQLRAARGPSAALVEACAISDDLDCLQEIAADPNNGESQLEAIQAMGIVGGDEVNATLVETYRGASSENVRDAALEGLMISGHDAGVLELYRTADSSTEKKELLELLVVMDSDQVWELIDAALDGDE